MNRYEVIYRKILWRSLPASLMIIWGWVLIHIAFGAVMPLLFGLLLCIVGLVIIVPPIVELFAELFSTVYYPAQAPVAASTQDARGEMSFYEKRFSDLKKLTDNDPQRLDAYIEMIDIAFNEFKDAKQAVSVSYRGMGALKKKEDRDRLAEAFNKAKTGQRLPKMKTY